jgi:tetratricopeptide (TPR) repeat protein
MIAALFSVALAFLSGTMDPGDRVAMVPGVSDQASISPGSAPLILVVAFVAPTRDGRTFWLGEAAALLITEDLSARGLGAISRTGRERAYAQLHLPEHAVLSRATVIKLGELVGATQVIVGDVRLDDDNLAIRATPIRIDVGRADAEVTERGKLGELFSVAQKVARRVGPGGTDSGLRKMPSLQTFEQYVKGLLAEQPATQASFLEAALRLDPAYDPARLALWDTRTAQGDHAAALAAVRGVGATSSEARHAQFLSGVSLIGLKQYDEAFGIFKTLLDRAPDPAVWNNLGIIQLRRSATAETGTPVYFLTKAAEGDPENPDVLFNLGYAYALDRDPPGALYWLREALRRAPTDSDAHYVLAAALDASGNAVEANRERELAGQLSARYADAALREPRRDPLPRGLGRIASDFKPRRSTGIDRTVTDSAQRDQQNLARFYLERGRRFFEAEQDREAMTELRRAVFLSPYEAEAHLLIGRIHLRAGRPRDAVDALKISIWSRDTAPAHVVMAEAYLRENDPASARTHLQRALALDPASADAKTMLDRINKGGR